MPLPFTVPRALIGRTVAILAPGTTLTEADCAAVYDSGVVTVAVGSAFLRAPWAHVIYSSDSSWWAHHAQSALKLPALFLTCDEGTPFTQVCCVPSSGEHGFDPDPRRLRNGNNSGFAATHCAVASGASKILMLGFDMHPGHFFGEHPPGLRNTEPEAFARWIANFNQVAPIYAGMGIDVVMCTESALTCFRRSTLAEGLAHGN